MTLIELLMTVIIGAIAFFPLAMPFIAERSFWGTGKRQTEAQRDAQIGLRAIARVAREGTAYDIAFAGPQRASIRFDRPTASSVCVRGGEFYQYRLLLRTDCDNASTEVELIDGIRSRVTNFTITEVVPDQLVNLHLEVSHQLTTTDAKQQNEVLETELFLRNAS